MKKTTLAVIFTAIAGIVSAQTIIPKVGFSLANSTYDPIDYSAKDDSKLLPGITFGIAYEKSFGNLISLQPEINFVRKGAKKSDTFYGDGYEFRDDNEFRLNYIEVPVLVKFKFGGNTKFYVQAGPSIAMGLGGKYTYESYFGETLNFKSEGKIKFGETPNGYEGDDIYFENKFDAGIQFGGGALLFGKVIIDVRYGLGLTDVSDDYDSKNRVLQFNVGVPLNLF